MLVGDVVSDGLMLFGDDKRVNEGVRLLRMVLADMANFDGATPADPDAKVRRGEIPGWHFLRITRTYQTVTGVDSVAYSALTTSIATGSKGIRILSTGNPRELTFLPIDEFNALFDSSVHENPRYFNNDNDIIKFAPAIQSPNLPELTIRGFAPFSIAKLTDISQNLTTLFGIPDDWQYYLPIGLADKLSFFFGHDVNQQQKFKNEWNEKLQLMRRADANL